MQVKIVHLKLIENRTKSSLETIRLMGGFMGNTKRNSWRPAVFAISAVAVVACGPVANSNKPMLDSRIENPSVSGRDIVQVGEAEPTLGIVGGANITNTNVLHVMRFIRQVATINTGDSFGTKAKVNRYCAGISMSPTVTLTASHCLNLTTNLEYDFFRYFYIAPKHVCPSAPNPDGTPTCYVRPLGMVGAGLQVASPFYNGSYYNNFTFSNTGSVAGSIPVTGLRTSFYNDVGFAYTATNLTGSFVAPCTTLPAVGQTVYVTGLRLGSKTSTSTTLTWATYTAKVNRVLERLGEVSLFDASQNAWVKNYTRSWSFESTAVDATACAEKGDSGGAVFFQEVAGGPLCLMGVNIAAGVAENVNTTAQKCTPTTHRRITNQMVSSMAAMALPQCKLSAADPNCYNYGSPDLMSGPGAKINYSIISTANKEFGL
jgi:hypothetical protein